MQICTQIRGDNYEEIMSEAVLKRDTVQFPLHICANIKRDLDDKILFLIFKIKYIIFVLTCKAIFVSLVIEIDNLR